MNNLDKTSNTQQASLFKRTSKHPSEQTRQKISASLRGRVVTDATRQKLSASLHDYWNNPANFPDDQ